MRIQIAIKMGQTIKITIRTDPTILIQTPIMCQFKTETEMTMETKVGDQKTDPSDRFIFFGAFGSFCRQENKSNR